MRNHVITILKLVVIVLFLCLMLLFTARLLRRNECYTKNEDFYAADTSYDVFFLGSSHTVMGVLPMELWNTYGITSYNLANNGQWCAGDYWVLKNALDHKRPSLVVLDAYAVFADEKHAEGHMDYLHESFDPVPLSPTKINGVFDLFSAEHTIEFLFPFSTYHSRWESLDSTFFERSASCQKGAYENASTARPMVNPFSPAPLVPTEDRNTTETISKAYLRKSIELCQESGIPVLLTVTPFHASADLQEWVNSVYDIAKEYNVPFLNGLHEDVIDYRCDLWDEGHLNSSGARKWTRFLGGYLSENFALSDRRADPAYAVWHDDYHNYRMYEAEQLYKTEQLYPFLMLLHDDDFSYCILISETSTAFDDDIFWDVFYGVTGISPASADRGRFYIIDNGADTRSSFSAEARIDGFAASFGTISFDPGKDGASSLVLSDTGNTYWTLPGDVRADVQILVFDSSTGTIVERSWCDAAPKYDLLPPF